MILAASQNGKSLQYFKPTCPPTQSLSEWETNFSFSMFVLQAQKPKRKDKKLTRDTFQLVHATSLCRTQLKVILKTRHLNKSMKLEPLRAGLCRKDFFHQREAENMEHCLLERHLQRIKFAVKFDTLTLFGLRSYKMLQTT